jgi:uncharacterized low-complexity protein
MQRHRLRNLSLGAGIVLAGSLIVPAALAGNSPFKVDSVTPGQLLADNPADAQGICGEGKCGEGRCGGADMGRHVHDGPVTEGRCGEGKCGEGKCGGDAMGRHTHAAGEDAESA